MVYFFNLFNKYTINSTNRQFQPHFQHIRIIIMATSPKSVIPLTIVMMKQATESGDQILLPDQRGKHSLNFRGPDCPIHAIFRRPLTIHVILLTYVEKIKS